MDGPPALALGLEPVRDKVLPHRKPGHQTEKWGTSSKYKPYKANVNYYSP